MRRIPFTKKGYEDIKNEQKKLVGERKIAVGELAKYRAMGDLSENSAFRAAKARLSSLDYQLRRLENLISLGEVVEPTPGVAGIGTKVTVSDGKQIIKYCLVGQYEADPMRGKLSYLSPIGKALIGKREGEVIAVKVPAGNIVYKIIKIEIENDLIV